MKNKIVWKILAISIALMVVASSVAMYRAPDVEKEVEAHAAQTVVFEHDGENIERVVTLTYIVVPTKKDLVYRLKEGSPIQACWKSSGVTISTKVELSTIHLQKMNGYNKNFSWQAAGGKYIVKSDNSSGVPLYRLTGSYGELTLTLTGQNFSVLEKGLVEAIKKAAAAFYISHGDFLDAQKTASEEAARFGLGFEGMSIYYTHDIGQGKTGIVSESVIMYSPTGEKKENYSEIVEVVDARGVTIDYWKGTEGKLNKTTGDIEYTETFHIPYEKYYKECVLDGVKHLYSTNPKSDKLIYAEDVGRMRLVGRGFQGLPIEAKDNELILHDYENNDHVHLKLNNEGIHPRLEVALIDKHLCWYNWWSYITGRDFTHPKKITLGKGETEQTYVVGSCI